MALAGSELRLADCELRACGEGGIVVGFIRIDPTPDDNPNPNPTPQP